MTETITILQNIAVYELPDLASSKIGEYQKMDYVTRLKEARIKGVTWSKIILNDGNLGYIESKHTFTWRPIKISEPYIYYHSLEANTKNERIQVSIGAMINIVAPGKPHLIRDVHNSLGQLPDSVQLKPPNVFSPAALSIIVGILCFLVFFIYLHHQSVELDYQNSFRYGRRSRGGGMIPLVLLGLPLAAIVGASYIFFEQINVILSHIIYFFSKIKKAIFREINIRI